MLEPDKGCGAFFRYTWETKVFYDIRHLSDVLEDKAVEYSEKAAREVHHLESSSDSLPRRPTYVKFTVHTTSLRPVPIVFSIPLRRHIL